MKSVIIAGLFLIGAALGNIPTRAEMEAARDKCAAELGTPADYVQEMTKFKFQDIPIVHKQVRCTSIELGYWSDETGFDVDKLANTVFSREAILKCVDANEEKSSSEAWAYRNFVCVFKRFIDAAKRKADKALNN